MRLVTRVPLWDTTPDPAYSAIGASEISFDIDQLQADPHVFLADESSKAAIKLLGVLFPGPTAMSHSPIEAVDAGEVILCPQALALWTEAHRLQVALLDAYKSPSLPSVASMQKVIHATDFACGTQTEMLLGNDLPWTRWLTYNSTIREKSYSEDPPYALAEFVANEGDLRLARGRVGDSHHTHWYFTTNCGEPQCESKAYVRLKHEKDWYGEGRLDIHDARVLTYAKDVAAANAVNALCPYHRSHTQADSSAPESED